VCVQGEVSLIDGLYHVLQVCSVAAAARCCNTADKAWLFSQHYDGQGWSSACSC